MLFKNSLSILAAGILAIGGVCADDCSDAPIDANANKLYGKLGHKPATGFCHTKWTAGLVVTGVEVWATKYQISGLQFTFSDTSKYNVLGAPVFGTNKKGDDSKGGDNKHFAINWNAGDKIDVMKLASNHDGDGLGLVHIEVGGKKLLVNSDKTGDGDSINVGSGLLLGASGETSSFVTAFQPLFMGINDGHAEMTDLQFDDSIDDINKKQAGLSAMTLSDVYIKNTNPVGSNGTDQSWTFTGSVAKATSSSLTQTQQHTFGISEALEVSGKIGLPFVAEGSIKSTTTASYQYMSATQKMTGSQDTQTLQWSSGSTATSDLIKAGHAKHCTAKTITGNYHGDYTATVKIHVSGRDFSYKQKGTFDSISYSSVFQECNDMLLKDVPSDATQKEASETVKNGKRAVPFLS